MTEFDRWRLARQEADQLLQQLKRADAEQPEPPERPAAPGRSGPAAAMRAAAWRLLHPLAR